VAAMRGLLPPTAAFKDAETDEAVPADE